MKRAALAAFAAIAVSAGAETNLVTTLPTVVVEASRTGLSKSEMASHVDVLTRADVDSSGASSVAALLERRANVYFRSCGNPALAQISMRGCGANGFGRVKVVVDGEELNNADMSAQNFMRVPVRSVERVEILRGPQTVLHGGDASAGVVNVTSDADGYERKSEVETHVGNLETVGGHAGTRGGDEPSGVTYFADLDYDRSHGWRDNAEYEFWSAKGGVKKRFANGSWWALRTFYANSSYGLPGGLHAGLMRDACGLYGGGVDYGGWKSRARSAEDRSSHARNDVCGFSLSGLGVVDDENEIRASLSFRNRRSRSYGCLEYDVYGVSETLTYTHEGETFGHDNRFDAGFDGKFDLLYGDSSRTGSAGGENDYQRLSTALFARDEFALLDAVSVFAGVRGASFVSRDAYDGAFEYDYGSRTYRRVEGASNGSDAVVAGEAGVVWRPVENVKTHVKWVRHYHAPLADELFSSYSVPNMDLEPETGNTAEFGVDWTFCSDWDASFTAYHADVADEITYMNGGNVNAPDRIARDGVEASFGWNREELGSFGVLYAFTRARFAEGAYDGNDVPLVPRQLLRVFGEWRTCDWLAVHGGMRFVGEQRYGGDFANAGGDLASYALFDCGVRVTPSWAWAKGVSFAFDVDNLFDWRHASYGEYFNPWYVYPGNGRTFLFSVRCEF